MRSRTVALFGMFVLLCLAYFIYLLGLMNGAELSKAFVAIGSVPIMIHVVIWMFFWLFPKKYRPSYTWGEFYFILIYLFFGIVFFSVGIGASLISTALILGAQIMTFFFFILISASRFDADLEAGKIHKSVSVSGNKVLIKGQGLVLYLSYEKKSNRVWVERLYGLGKGAFFFLLLAFSLLGGGAGLILVNVIDNLLGSGFSISPHSMTIVFLSFLIIPIVAFGIPVVRHHFIWWRNLDDELRKVYRSVDYVWPLDDK